MKIAAAAYPIDWHNRWNEFVGKLRVWVRTAAENGAGLLVFPENGALELASLAGEENAKDPARAREAVSARIRDVDELHASLAREFGVHICASSGPLRAESGVKVSRARFFAPSGAMGFQDKQSPSAFETEVEQISAGTVGRIFATDLGRIGVLPGGDAAFAAPALAMAAAGAEILLVPTCAPDSRAFWRARIAARARAVETRCFVAQAVTVGEADWLATATKNVGAAAVFAPPEDGLPEDGTVGSGKMNAAGWVYGEVDLEALRVARGARPEPVPAAAFRVETVALGTLEAEPAQGSPAGSPTD